MKIIVTGCKGQLGTEIIKQLREALNERIKHWKMP